MGSTNTPQPRHDTPTTPRHTIPPTPPHHTPHYTTPPLHHTTPPHHTDSYTAFLSFHLWLVCRNYTTIEFCEKRGAADSRYVLRPSCSSPDLCPLVLVHGIDYSLHTDIHTIT